MKAARTPINGPYKEAAKLVRRLLGWEEGSTRPYLSTRNAQNKTGISNGTINAPDFTVLGVIVMFMREVK